jgi:hypothetical protein
MNKNRSAWSPLTSILSHPSLRLVTEGRGSIFYVNLFSKLFGLLPYQFHEQEETEKRWLLVIINLLSQYPSLLFGHIYDSTYQKMIEPLVSPSSFLIEDY